jgi:hypothetical protein
MGESRPKRDIEWERAKVDGTTNCLLDARGKDTGNVYD